MTKHFTLYMSMIALCAAAGSASAKEPHPVSMAAYEHQMKQHKAKGSWEPMHPSENPFAAYSTDDIKALLGLPATPRAPPSFGQRLGASDGLPATFDARDTFGACSHAIRNQLQCGSCWAFGAAETLTDNLCVAGQTDVPELSEQDLVSCNAKNHGCQGGDLLDAWSYIVSEGLVSEACLPYSSGNGTVAKCAPYMCTGEGTYKKFKCSQKAGATGDGYNMLEETSDIKNGVMHMGAAETGFTVYSDFMQYKSGVYSHDNTTSNMPLGGHAVKILGWGTDAIAGDYYLVANSWGPAWGMSGYFKIAMSDTYSAFAIGGGFNCGDLPPTPQPPSPGPAPSKCVDLLPSCKDFKNMCSAVHGECMQTCGCCADFDKPAYCSK